MLPIQRIEFYICTFQVIFQHFGTLAAKVSINQNITGLVGNKDTYVTCSFYLEKWEQILSVYLFAKNITEEFDDNNHIAIFEPGKAARILQPGKYLSRRVTLTNITNLSTNATLLFNVLQCTDEKDYMCKFFYYDMNKVVRIRNSLATRISVKVQVNQVHIKNEPNQTQYDQKTDNITLTCKASGDPEPSYVWYKENSNRSVLSTTDIYVIRDVTRNNSGVYICQAYNTINNVIYNNSTSVKIDIVDELLPQSESVLSEIFAVQTRHVNVKKQPNQKQYDRKTDQINLTCTAIGNPEPEYIWFKQDNKDNILSKTNNYVIGDVNPNKSGIYICEAFNIINNVMYRNSYSVAIDIVEKLLQTESESIKVIVVHAAYAVSFIFTVVVVVICFAIRKHCNRKKSNIHSDDQENISVDDDYAEIERISYHEVNPHNDRNDVSNQPITEEEIVLENIPFSSCTSSNKSNIQMSHLYVNTDIFNTNESHRVFAYHETISDHPNELENYNIGVDNTFVSDNSGIYTLQVNQYVNTTSIRVPNVYEDLIHTTVDTHKYESPHVEGNTACTE